jgi:hypothetical protein
MTPNPPRPTDLSKDDLRRMLLEHLGGLEWQDLTGAEGLDPEAVETWAVGHPSRRGDHTLFLLSRYEDPGREFALVSSTGVRPEPKQVTTDERLLAWLWERVHGGLDPIPA